MQSLLQANAEKAAEIKDILKTKKVLMVNLISSPGAGKTSLLEKTLPKLVDKYNVAVIEGDVETDLDGKRLDGYGVPISLINTNGACHLESISIEKALSVFDLDKLDLIIIENVGNLVCPAEFDIGEDYKVAVVSTPEGADKPAKYPLLFQEASLLINNKIDLLPYINFDKEFFTNEVKKLNGNLPIIPTSCKNDIGIDEWVSWLEQKIKMKKTD